MKRSFEKYYQMSTNLVEKIDKLSSHLTGKREIENKNVYVKKKKERRSPVFEGDYYFDFKNGLRYVYPYDVKFRLIMNKNWYEKEVGEVYHQEIRIHSPDTLQYLFRSGIVTVNEKIVNPTYRIKKRDQIASSVHRHENPVFASKIEIIKETDDILVINKPSSIPIHPAGNYRLNTILAILFKEYSYKSLFIVHRLDRLTSGVLIFAKNPEKARELSQMIVSRNVEKEYVCKVEGEFPIDQIVCTEKLDTCDRKLGIRFVSDKGKDCVTKFKRLHTDGKISIVHCKLETGRTHQIRVHLQFLGHPICNDPIYNSYAFGPNKGKGAEYHNLKSVEQLIKNINEEHPNNKLHGNNIEFKLSCRNLEQSLAQGEFYDDVNFKLADESRFELIRNELFEQHVHELEATDEMVDKYIDDLANCDVLNIKNNLAYLIENKHMKFSRENFIVNPTCELCHMYHKPPRLDVLSLDLHAMRYTICDQTYFAPPPSWAHFSDQFDYFKSNF